VQCVWKRVLEYVAEEWKMGRRYFLSISWFRCTLWAHLSGARSRSPHTLGFRMYHIPSNGWEWYWNSGKAAFRVGHRDRIILLSVLRSTAISYSSSVTRQYSN